MTVDIDAEKLAPADLARATVLALGEDLEEVLVDEFSRQVKAASSDDHRAIYPDLQRQFDAAVAT